MNPLIHWLNWIRQSKQTIKNYYLYSSGREGKEGLSWNNGYWATFWYVLNLSWFKMQNKMTSYSDDSRPFQKPRNYYDT